MRKADRVQLETLRRKLAEAQRASAILLRERNEARDERDAARVVVKRYNAEADQSIRDAVTS